MGRIGPITPRFVTTVVAKLVVVSGAVIWFFSGSLIAGIAACVAAAYLWIGFWVDAIAARRARARGADPEPFIERGASRLFSQVLERDPDKPISPRAKAVDRALSEHPFLTMSSYMAAVFTVICAPALFFGWGVGDLLGMVLFGVLLGGFIGGGVVWLAENKPDTSHAVTQTLQQSQVRGDPPLYIP